MTNAVTNAAAGFERQLAGFCADYATLSFDLAWWFLVGALLAAAVETGVALWSKLVAARSAPRADPSRATDADSVAKLLEALKGLLEALTKLPAWVAIFLAGLALLWMAGQRPEICVPQVGAETPRPAPPAPPAPAPARRG